MYSYQTTVHLSWNMWLNGLNLILLNRKKSFGSCKVFMQINPLNLMSSEVWCELNSKATYFKGKLKWLIIFLNLSLHNFLICTNLCVQEQPYLNISMTNQNTLKYFIEIHSLKYFVLSLLMYFCTLGWYLCSHEVNGCYAVKHRCKLEAT